MINEMVNIDIQLFITSSPHQREGLTHEKDSKYSGKFNHKNIPLQCPVLLNVTILNPESKMCSSKPAAQLKRVLGLILQVYSVLHYSPTVHLELFVQGHFSVN